MVADVIGSRMRMERSRRVLGRAAKESVRSTPVAWGAEALEWSTRDAPRCLIIRFPSQWIPKQISLFIVACSLHCDHMRFSSRYWAWARYAHISCELSPPRKFELRNRSESFSHRAQGNRTWLLPLSWQLIHFQKMTCLTPNSFLP